MSDNSQVNYLSRLCLALPFSKLLPNIQHVQGLLVNYSFFYC